MIVVSRFEYYIVKAIVLTFRRRSHYPDTLESLCFYLLMSSWQLSVPIMLALSFFGGVDAALVLIGTPSVITFCVILFYISAKITFGFIRHRIRNMMVDDVEKHAVAVAFTDSETFEKFKQVQRDFPIFYVTSNDLLIEQWTYEEMPPRFVPITPAPEKAIIAKLKGLLP